MHAKSVIPSARMRIEGNFANLAFRYTHAQWAEAGVCGGRVLTYIARVEELKEAHISLSVTKCCKFTHIKNVNRTCTFLNFDPVGGRHGGIISQKTPTQPLKWSVGT